MKFLYAAPPGHDSLRTFGSVTPDGLVLDGGAGNDEVEGNDRA